MANILLVTHWTYGDVLPFIKFGSELIKEGHDVTIFTHCVFRERAEERGLSFVALDNPGEYRAMTDDFNLLSDPVRHLEDVLLFNSRYHGADCLLREFHLIAPYCGRKDTVLVSRHRSSISAQLAAEYFHLPYASVVLAPNYLSHMQLHEQLMGKEMCAEINRARRVLGLRQITSWSGWLCSPKVMIGMWPAWFKLPGEDWPETLRTVGFPSSIKGERKTLSPSLNISSAKAADGNEYEKSLPEEPEALTVSKKKKVLVTGGTSRMIDPAFFTSAIRGCENLDVTAILVTAFEEYIPARSAGTVIWLREADMGLLMEKVDAVIHHGGMGTLSEALSAGVPQLILPKLADRPDNAQRMVLAGLAESVPPGRWGGIKLEEKLSKVLSAEYAGAYRERIAGLTPEKEGCIGDIIDEMAENSGIT